MDANLILLVSFVRFR